MMELQTSSGETSDGRRKPRFFQFGLRAFFVGITIVSITLGITCKRFYDRKAAIQSVQDAGGTMGYSISGPKWLQTIIRDEECFYEPQRISLGPLAGSKLDDDILASLSKPLKAFRDLQALDIRRSAVTDKSGPLLAELTSLTHLRLGETGIGDQSIGHIKKLPNLQVLMLFSTDLTDDCVDDICQITTLTGLNIQRTKITQNGVNQLTESLPACKIDY